MTACFSRFIVGVVLGNYGFHGLYSGFFSPLHPVVHPFAVVPVVRAEEANFFTCHQWLNLVIHGQELGVFQFFVAHGGASEGEGIEFGYSLCSEICRLDDGCCAALCLYAFSYEIGHGFRVASTAPIYDCYVAHELLLVFGPTLLLTFGRPCH